MSYKDVNTKPVSKEDFMMLFFQASNRIVNMDFEPSLRVAAPSVRASEVLWGTLTALEDRAIQHPDEIQEIRAQLDLLSEALQSTSVDEDLRNNYIQGINTAHIILSKIENDRKVG